MYINEVKSLKLALSNFCLLGEPCEDLVTGGWRLSLLYFILGLERISLSTYLNLHYIWKWEGENKEWCWESHFFSECSASLPKTHCQMIHSLPTNLKICLITHRGCTWIWPSASSWISPEAEIEYPTWFLSSLSTTSLISLPWISRDWKQQQNLFPPTVAGLQVQLVPTSHRQFGAMFHVNAAVTPYLPLLEGLCASLRASNSWDILSLGMKAAAAFLKQSLQLTLPNNSS